MERTGSGDEEKPGREDGERTGRKDGGAGSEDGEDRE